jgi:hypothetical protein
MEGLKGSCAYIPFNTKLALFKFFITPKEFIELVKSGSDPSAIQSRIETKHDQELHF